MVYYNENDSKAAAWLRELIKGAHIASGEVDERSIEDVCPVDLRGYTQYHFFAGIGGWSYALRLAGWPDDRPVWTGSCPCQPFSAAGKGKGFADNRHLWPAWFWLIAKCNPGRIFGEQVASPAGLAWYDVVRVDLEFANYAVGAANLCAAGVGAPHIRQRLYWVADSERRAAKRHGFKMGIAPRKDQGREEKRQRFRNDAWNGEYVDCRDGKRRPVEPGTLPLAHGVPGRVGLLRGYGNAIVPQVAAAFIKAYAKT
jgi:DNA (cytosine-5)-methyltransferase 1